MNVQTIIDDLKSLPESKQEGAADFIAYLKPRFGVKNSLTTQNATEKSDGFVGMWKDRAEMEDSSSWVHDLRRGEWERSRDAKNHNY